MKLNEKPEVSLLCLPRDIVGSVLSINIYFLYRYIHKIFVNIILFNIRLMTCFASVFNFLSESLFKRLFATKGCGFFRRKIIFWSCLLAPMDWFHLIKSFLIYPYLKYFSILLSWEQTELSCKKKKMMYQDISSALLGRYSTSMYIYTSAVYCVHCKLYTVHRNCWRNLINLGFLILLSTIFFDVWSH